MVEHKITIDYDELVMAPTNLVNDLNKVLNDFGIFLEIEDEEHDGYDVCIVQIKNAFEYVPKNFQKP